MSWWKDLGNWLEMRRLVRNLRDTGSLLKQLLEKQQQTGRLIPLVRRDEEARARKLREALEKILGPTALVASYYADLDPNKCLMQLAKITKPGGGKVYLPINRAGTIVLVIARQPGGKASLQIEIENPGGRLNQEMLQDVAKSIVFSIHRAAGSLGKEIPIIYLDEDLNGGRTIGG